MRSAAATPASHPVSTWTWPRVMRPGIVARLVRLDAAYRERQTLAEMDDRLLQDIGITRADVEHEASQPLRW